jgi:hypothetical protein
MALQTRTLQRVFIIIGVISACATSSGSGPAQSRVARFSPSASLKVLFLDFRAPEFPESDVQHVGDLFLDSLVGARQAEVVNARDLPDLRDESSRAAYEGDRSPGLLGKHAQEVGADVVVTGSIFKVGRNLAFTIEAVDAQGHLADGAGGKGSEWTSLEATLRRAGGDLMRPMPKAEGPPTAGDAARVLAARSGLFDRCYARALQRAPSLVGRGILSVALGASVEPTDVTVSSSSFNDADFEACLADAVRHMKFPILVGETTLSYPVAYVE